MNAPTPQRQRLLVILTAAMVGLFVLDSAVVEPLINVWKAHAAEIAVLQKKVGDGRNLIVRGPQLDRTWADMQTNALPKDAAQGEQDVLSAFDRWGRATSVEVGAIRPQWKRGATDKYSLLECRVDTTGSLTTVSRFLYELERSPLALRVDSVEISSRDDGGQRLTLALVVSGLRFSPLERKL
jgi:hypothetical protein